MKYNSFSKAEHLCGEKKITQLFTDGNAFIVYPLRLVYILVPEEDRYPVKLLVNVAKKRFKRAVKRNKIKRLLRESYRTNKQPLWGFLKEKKSCLQLSLQYIANEELDYHYLEKRMQKALEKLQNLIANDEKDF